MHHRIIIIPVARESDAKTPNMQKALLFFSLSNIKGAKSDPASLNPPWIIAWYSGDIEVAACSDANCQIKMCCWLRDKQNVALPYLHKCMCIGADDKYTRHRQ